MAPQITHDICSYASADFSRCRAPIKPPRGPGQSMCADGETKLRIKVSLTALPVITQMHDGTVNRKSCLKTGNSSTPSRKCRQFRFNPQIEVRYYLNRPLVVQTGFRRILSNIRGKFPSLPTQFSPSKQNKRAKLNNFTATSRCS